MTTDTETLIHNAIRDVALEVQRRVTGHAISKDDASLDTLVTDTRVCCEADAHVLREVTQLIVYAADALTEGKLDKARELVTRAAERLWVS